MPKKHKKKIASRLNKEFKEKIVIDEIELEEKKLKQIEKNEIKKFKQEEYKRVISEVSQTIEEQINNAFYQNTNTKYIIHSAGPNSGKTYQALKRLKESNGKCLYLSPLRLLCYEISDKLNNEGFPCDLVTGEERILIYNSKITSSTVEMCDYNNYHDIVIIDECVMLSDKFRGCHWLKAILQVKAKEVHIILNKEVEDLVNKILTITNKKFTINRYERLVPLEISKNIYNYDDLPNRTAIVCFSRIRCIMLKVMLERKGYTVSLLFGNLPPEVKKKQIERFNNGETQICVTTDVIGFGLNLSLDYVLFDAIEKYNGEENTLLTPSQLNQIGARAGRYLLSDKGIVSAFNSKDLRYIKNNIYTFIETKNTYFPIDENIINILPRNTIYEKLLLFNELDFIPLELKEFIKRQDTKQLIDILQKSNIEYKLDNIIDDKIKLIWKLITLPISDLNFEYFNTIIKNINNNKLIDIPKMTINNITSNTELSEAESICSQYDLYLYGVRNKYLSKYFIEYIDLVLENKEIIVNLIDNYIVDSKKMGIKLCSKCKKDIGIETPHKMCDKCFEKVK